MPLQAAEDVVVVRPMEAPQDSVAAAPEPSMVVQAECVAVRKDFEGVPGGSAEVQGSDAACMVTR
jgi:hypothetical protein